MRETEIVLFRIVQSSRFHRVRRFAGQSQSGDPASIKRSGTIRLQPICPALTRPASLFLADEADHDDPLIRVLAPLRSTLCCHAVTASKWVSSFQIRPNSAASLRATATRARFGPRRFSTLRPSS